jgi:hypothetical protein
MNILDTLLGAQNNDAVQQLASNFGIGEKDARAAITHLIPALTGGIQKNITQEGGLTGLLNALRSGSHTEYLERPDLLRQDATVQEGNAILGHILGSKDVSRNVAGHAAKETGLDFGMLKKRLPVVATMVMGALSKQATHNNVLEGAGRTSGSSAIDLLGSFLDSNKDGSVVDDLLGMAKRFF